jgi:hypothetical protein
MADEHADKSVMGNLPSTRPARIGGRRDAKSGPAAPKSDAKPKATATAKPKASAKPKPATTSSKPRAVRSGSPALKAAKTKGTPRKPPQPATPPKGTELVTTAVQAAGELAQIGLTLGAQVAKRAVRRLPKP